MNDPTDRPNGALAVAEPERSNGRRNPRRQAAADGEAARTYAAAELASGRRPTGRALADRFDVSERTGRRIVAELDPDGRPDSGHGHADRPATNADRSATTGRPAMSGHAEDLADDRTASPKRQGVARWDRGIAYIVGLIAVAASYGHMREVALMAGETPWIAYLMPLTVDGLAIAAWRQGERGRFWLAIGMAASVAANILTDYPEVIEQVSWAIKAFPPVAIFGIHQLLHNGASETSSESPAAPLSRVASHLASVISPTGE